MFLSSDYLSLHASRTARRLLAFALQILRLAPGRSTSRERCLEVPIPRSQFLQSKGQGMWSAKQVGALQERIKEQIMEYLILLAVVAAMALYALIIVVCVKQPEW